MLPEITRARQAMEDCAALAMRCAVELGRAEGAIRTEIECRRVAAFGGAAEAGKQRDFSLAAADKAATQSAEYFGLAMAKMKECGADDLARKAQAIADQVDVCRAAPKPGGPRRGDNFRGLGVIDGVKPPRSDGPEDAA